MSLSPLLAKMGIGTAWTVALISRGSSNGMVGQSQPLMEHTSLILRFSVSRGSGPRMIFLKGLRFDQQSYQKFSLLSWPSTHLTPFLNTSSYYLSPFHVGKQESLAAFLELILYLVQYINFRILDQGALPSICSLQLSLAKKVVFLPLAVCSPNPPRFFGLVTLLQFTQCIFLA